MMLRPRTYRCLCMHSIQFFLNAQAQNTAITMQTNPMKSGNCRRIRENDANRIRNESDQERQYRAFLEVCTRNSTYMFFDATTGSKNYTICKIHVSDIFLR